MILESKSVQETQKIAAELAGKITASGKGVVIALEGELGAGKTTFTQGFAQALGIKEKIKSPTFVFIKSYKISRTIAQSELRDRQNTKIKTLHHIDCYRVSDYEEMRIPELHEILSSDDIVIIEWAERVKEMLPKNHITVHIDHVGENERKITITNA